MSVSSPWTRIWITGASSGIGRELALRLAGMGANVAVSARSADKLRELEALSPRIKAYPLDVTDRAKTAAAAKEIEALLGGPIDLAVLNAGVWEPMGASGFDAGKAVNSMTVNYLSITYALEGLIPLMKTRGAGHLALVSSVAGYRGLPKSAAYAPSKAALISLAEVLYPDLERYGVKVKVINPGFVKTPMTDVNKFPMPFLIEVDEAIDRIVEGLQKNKFEIAFPRQMVFWMKILRMIRYKQFFRVVRWTFMPRSVGGTGEDV
jgi:short-subunit dehydrogenase